MNSFLFIAFLGGLLTIAAPCILAVLPIILGSTLGNQNKLRPVAIVVGLTASFTGFGLLFHYVTTLFGISNNTLRIIALSFLLLFSLALIFPVSYEKFLFKIKEIFMKIFPPKNATLHDVNKSSKKKGLLNGFIVGASLGLVWVPCAGPILGVILTLAATQSDISKVAFLLLSYSLGAGLPMLLIAYGGNFIVSKTKILKKNGEVIQRISGVLLFFGVLFIMAGLDAKISVMLANYFPNLNNFEQSIVDKNLNSGSNILAAKTENSSSIQSESELALGLQPKGQIAPEIIGTQSWINSPPLQLSDLKGKVVIVDFWTYSCINCIRTLPYISRWYEKYKGQGLVIIGVHSPEFAFEKELPNVQNAVKDFHISYPVVQDNDYKTWNNYANQYWPAKYIIDRDGYIRSEHFGEGAYDHTEKVIQALLAEGNSGKINSAPLVESEQKNPLSQIQNMGMPETPETYLGTDRGEYYGNKQRRLAGQIQNYSAPPEFERNTFYLDGAWLNQGENIVLQKPHGKIIIQYQSNKINLVADKTDKPVRAKVLLDGKPLPKEKFGKNIRPDGTFIVDKASLYNLVNTGNIYEKHTITIEFEDINVKAYVFTFG